MRQNKKALETHLLVLVLISVIMTVLIVSVFSAFFKNDHPNCQNFEFEISRKCLKGSGLEISVENTGNSMINFKASGAFTREYQVGIGEVVDMDFGTRGEDTIDVIPFVKTVSGEEFECRGKTEEIQIGRLIKCS